MTNTAKTISWIARIVIALIFIQTLFFKFTGAEESRYIFTTLMGAEYEAVGRIGSGLMELVAAILILMPRTAPYGAILALAAISGAIFSHLTKLGIVVKDDGGALFAMAITVFVLTAAVLFIHRRELPVPGNNS